MKLDAELYRKYHEDGWWRDGTFLDDLRRNVAGQPGKTALVGRFVAKGQTKVIDYAELSRLTSSMVRGLADLGVQPGEFIGVQIHDCWEMLPLTLACLQAGVKIATMPSLYRIAELEYILGLTGARLFITTAELHGGRPPEVAATLAGKIGLPERVAVVGGGGPPGTLSFEEHFLADPDQEAAPAGPGTDPDEPFLLLFTSGTTGENKAAMHSQNTLYAGILGYAGALGLDDTLVAMTPHTNMHYGGLVTTMLTSLALGGTAVLAEDDGAVTNLELIEQHGVTLLYAAPMYVRAALAAQRSQPHDVSSLRYVVSGSAPVPPQLIDEVHETLGVRMFSLWGMTENGAVTVTRPTDPLDWPASSDGSPAGGMEVRIDPLAGQTDGSGVLRVRGPAQCLGYYKREDVYAADIDADGWFNTGDLAKDDGRGGIRLTGRVKDIILHQAFNVPATVIEEMLGRHPKVADVAVIGIPDPDVDERVCAVVTLAGDSPPTLDELRDYMRDAGVTSLWLPERLEVIEAMPRTAMGKLRKIDLRKRFPN
jgi:cyclohexanecarboxylate-CoA ligase